MKNLLSILFFFLALTVSSIAQTVVKYQDYASQGGKSATVQGSNSSNKFAQVYPSCTVTVYLTGTTTLATLYSDTLLTSKSNPFTATSEGYYEFFAIPGQYDIRISGTGVTTPFTRSRVELQIGQANVLGGTVDYLQLKSSSSALGDSPIYKSGGVVHGATAGSGTNTTQLATTAFVQQEVPIASVSARGKAYLGAKAKYALGSRPTCNSSLAADRITIQVTDGNRSSQTCMETSTGVYAWVDEDGGKFLAARFNVKADGSSDDTAALQAALTAAQAAATTDGDVKTVLLPAGTIRISSRLTITSGNVIVQGAGTLLKWTGSARDIAILVQGTATNGEIHNVTIKDLTIDMQNKGQLDAGAIQINSCDNFLIDHVYLKNGGVANEAGAAGVAGIAVSCKDTSSIYYSTGAIQNSVIENFTKPAILTTNGTKEIAVRNNHIRNITGNGNAPGIAILSAVDIVAEGNWISFVEGAGISVGTTSNPVNVYRLSISGNHINNAGQGGSGSVYGSGIFVSSLQADKRVQAIIANNHVKDTAVDSGGSLTANSAGDGILIDSNMKQISLLNNFVSGSKRSGITVRDGNSYLQVIGGQLWNNNRNGDSAGSGILLGNISNFLIDNVIAWDDQGTKTQEYGVYFSGTAATGRLQNSNLLNNKTAAYNKVGAWTNVSVVNVMSLSTDNWWVGRSTPGDTRDLNITQSGHAKFGGRLGVKVEPTYSLEAAFAGEDYIAATNANENNFGFRFVKDVSAGSYNTTWLGYIPASSANFRLYSLAGGDSLEATTGRTVNVGAAVGEGASVAQLYTYASANTRPPFAARPASGGSIAGVFYDASAVVKNQLGDTGHWLASAGSVAWSSTADATGTKDTAISRSSAGMVEISNGSAGTLRDLAIRKVCYNTAGTVCDWAGSGSPESAVSASVGSTYRDTNGGASTTFYVKESGTGNTGWVAK